MIIDTLEDLYIEQLNDVYSANSQVLAITKDLVHAAADQGLSGALAFGVDGIQADVSALEAIAKEHDERLDATYCEAMQGLVKVAHAQALAKVFGGEDTRDAMIIIQYQRMVRYVFAGYECLAAFADRLELDSDVVALNRCLTASYQRGRTMTALATGRINRTALR